MQVIANVDEADIGGVKEGDRVNFTVDAYPDDVFQGTVKQVRLEATTTNNVVTYEVVISAPNADSQVKTRFDSKCNHLYTRTCWHSCCCQQSTPLYSNQGNSGKGYQRLLTAKERTKFGLLLTIPLQLIL